MTLPPSDHIIWKLIRQATFGIVLTILLTVNYQKFDSRDVSTILQAMATMFAFDMAKKSATTPKAKPSAEEETTEEPDA